MQRLIRGQDRLVRSIMILLFLFQAGCSTVKPNIQNNSEKLSCEEKAKPKSLQYLDQQYRCTTNK